MNRYIAVAGCICIALFCSQAQAEQKTSDPAKSNSPECATAKDKLTCEIDAIIARCKSHPHDKACNGNNVYSDPCTLDPTLPICRING